MPELWDIVDEHGRKTGRFHERGVPMKAGDYHPSVSVWIVNSRGEFLISRRAPAPGRHAVGMWEPTGGAVVAGEDSLTAALREVREELGLTLEPEQGRVYKSYTYPHSNGDGAAYITVWVFRRDADLDEIVLQPEETSDVMWADADTIRSMMTEGRFIPFDYFDDLCGWIERKR